MNEKKKLNAYYFNNAEYEDIFLCDKHDSPPEFGMWVKDFDKVEEDAENGIVCEACSDEENA